MRVRLTAPRMWSIFSSCRPRKRPSSISVRVGASLSTSMSSARSRDRPANEARVKVGRLTLSEVSAVRLRRASGPGPESR